MYADCRLSATYGAGLALHFPMITKMSCAIFNPSTLSGDYPDVDTDTDLS